MNNKLVIIFTFFLFASLLIGCSDKQNEISEYTEAPRMVKSQTLKIFSGSVDRHITGRLQAAQSTSLSFEVNGVLTSVNILLGQAFNEGDLLAQLNPKLYTLAVAQSEGSLDEARASLLDAKQTLNRNLELKKKGLLSQALVDSAQSAFSAANGRLSSAQSALSIAQQNLKDTQLFAPYSGTVSARFVEPNQQINTQTVIYTIQGNANLEVNAAVPESIIGRIMVGDQVQVAIPALDFTPFKVNANISQSAKTTHYAATLSELGTQASIANAFPMTITFNESDKRLLPGMSAEIILPLRERQNAFTQQTPNGSIIYEIPVAALATDAKGQYVQIINAQSGGYITQKEYIEIVQTLSQGVMARFKTYDTSTHDDIEVITAGLEFVTDKQVVTPLRTMPQIYNQ